MSKEYSEAENRFREYMKKFHPNLQITKKGLPDFMVLKNGEVIGFIEVKRMDLNDNLKSEQRLFRNFCHKHKIPYQVWMPGIDKCKNKWIKNRFIEKTTTWEI